MVFGNVWLFVFLVLRKEGGRLGREKGRGSGRESVEESNKGRESKRE